MKPATLISWIASLSVAGLFAFTGVFKLTGNPDAQATFAKIGGDPVMYFTGVIEVLGAVLAMGVMSGAIVSHLTNMVPNHDMLPMAIGLFLAAAAVAYLHRLALPIIGKDADRLAESLGTAEA